MKDHPVPLARLRKLLDGVLREKFIEQNSLMHDIRGEILELEFKNDEVMIQDLIDNLRIDLTAAQILITNLQMDLIVKDAEIQNLQDNLSSKDSEIIDLQDRVVVLETEPEPEIP